MSGSRSLLDDPGFFGELADLDLRVAAGSGRPDDQPSGGAAPSQACALADDPAFIASLRALDRGVHPCDPADTADPAPGFHRLAPAAARRTAPLPVRPLALSVRAGNAARFEPVAATVRTARVPATEATATSRGAYPMHLVAELDRIFNPAVPEPPADAPDLATHAPPPQDLDVARALPRTSRRRAPPLQRLGFAAFILLMACVGACASLLVFHERVSEIIRHW